MHSSSSSSSNGSSNNSKLVRHTQVGQGRLIDGLDPQWQRQRQQWRQQWR